MQGQVVPLQLGDTEILIETRPVAGSEETGLGNLRGAQEAVGNAFDHAQETIVAVANKTVETIGRVGKLAAQPDEVEVKFGLKFSAKGTVFVAEATGEANLEVRMLFRKQPNKASSERT